MMISLLSSIKNVRPDASRTGRIGRERLAPGYYEIRKHALTPTHKYSVHQSPQVLSPNGFPVANIFGPEKSGHGEFREYLLSIRRRLREHWWEDGLLQRPIRGTN